MPEIIITHNTVDNPRPELVLIPTILKEVPVTVSLCMKIIHIADGFFY